MDIIDILAGDSFIIYNKEFAKRHGVEPAVLLGAMCGYQKGFRNEYFYREQNKILDDTGLTVYSLRSSIKVLQELGIIEYEKRGMPAKYYYKVNAEKLERVVDLRKSRDCENVKSRDCEIINSCVCENDSTYNNNDKNYNKNKKESFLDIIKQTIQSEKVTAALQDWLDYKKERKDKKYTERGFRMLLDDLRKDMEQYGEQYVIDEINNSIKKGYMGIYPSKETSFNKPQKQEFMRHNYTDEQRRKLFETVETPLEDMF